MARKRKSMEVSMALMKRPFSKGLAFMSKWVFVTVLGWIISPLFVGNVLVHSWPEWRGFVMAYFVNGALIGAVVGFGQGWVFGLRQAQLLKGGVTTVVGYAIGLPASILLISALNF